MARIAEAPIAVFAARPVLARTAAVPAVSIAAFAPDADAISRLKQLACVLNLASRDAATFASVATSDTAGRAGEDTALMMEASLDASRCSRVDSLRALSMVLSAASPDEGSVQAQVIDAISRSAEKLDAGGLVWQSNADFFEQIGALLTILKTEWLSKYQDSLARFLKFYTSFSNIMEMLKPAASGDKGAVKIDFTAVHQKLTLLSWDYALDRNALAGFPSRAAAEAFRVSLGLPGLGVTGPGSGGLYYVKMDLSAVKGLIASMEDGTEQNAGNPLPNDHVMDSSAYNAWVNQKDSNVEQIKFVSKVLGEKLNEMTQKFDNIVKILSSSIDKMSEANMSYVRNT